MFSSFNSPSASWIRLRNLQKKTVNRAPDDASSKSSIPPTPTEAARALAGGQEALPPKVMVKPAVSGEERGEEEGGERRARTGREEGGEGGGRV